MRYLKCFVLLLLGVISGCQQPEPEMIDIMIESVTAEVKGEEVTLSAVFPSGYDAVDECGFLYGRSGYEMTDVQAVMDEGRFSSKLTGLAHSTEYVYQAYVTNGRNLVSSQLDTFYIEPPNPALSISPSRLLVPASGGTYSVSVNQQFGYVYIPESVDWVSYNCPDGECQVIVSENGQDESRSCEIRFVKELDEAVLHITQKGLSVQDDLQDGGEDDIQDGGEDDLQDDGEEAVVYTMSLEFTEHFAMSDDVEFSAYIWGNADFEVIIPDDVAWLVYDRTEVESETLRIVTFFIQENLSVRSRECDVVFRSLDHDYSCTLRVIQDGAGNLFYLTRQECDLPLPYEGWDCFVDISCRSVEEFEVVLPGVDWVTYYVDASAHRCYFTVSKNYTTEKRICDVAFQSTKYYNESPEDPYTCVFRIVQAGMPGPYVDLGTYEFTHMQQDFSILWSRGFPEGCESDNGWINMLGEGNGYMSFSVSENDSFDSREDVFLMRYSDWEYELTVLQHSYLENIDFKCPVAKQCCVGLWDRNGDGELSYEEVVSVEEFPSGCFDVEGMTSFDELQFFINAFQWDRKPSYLLEGSSLERASLPYSNGFECPGRGMFKDCRNLRNVQMCGWAVDAEMFMNCVSLREMDAIIRGECAFMGCTSLEKVVSRTNYVPDMAFKNCSSLSSFTFEEGREDEYYIGDEAFYGCSRLPQIKINRKVGSIGDRAFYGCSGLKAVYISSSVPPTLGTDAFTGTGSDMKIYVPTVLVGIYKSNWPALADRIYGI